ncbi:MAG: hypothetical protein JSS35_05340 [Proteobacteria bacterium]|nr:hypothetical protein [Pseudomonadota bacterium]
MTGLSHRLIGLAAALAALEAGAAKAATYAVIRSTAEAITVLDPGGVERLAEGRTRRAQIVRVQKSIAAEGPPQPGYVATLTDYDCGQWRYRWRGFSAYSRTGQRLLHKDNDNPAWSEVAGDFEATAAARIVCDGRAAGQVYAADSLGQLVGALMSAWDADPAPAVTPAPATLPPPRPKPGQARR